MGNRKIRRVTARVKRDRRKVSFWYAPLIMSLGAVLLAWIMYRIDLQIPNEILEDSRFILTGTPGELRSMLIGMSSTILATAGVVFTLLTIPLSTVAAQYGSRLLRVFLGDRVTQIVLGMFVAAFVYCLAAALSILPEDIEPDGPQLTATVGAMLMLGTFSSLILLVQHISTMLQAPNIAAAAGAELRDVLLAEMPEQLIGGDNSKNEYENQLNALAEIDAYPIRVRRAGYIQYVDPTYIMTLMREHDLVIQLLFKPGQFIHRETAVAKVWPASQVDDELKEHFHNAFEIGNYRTPTQDIAYAVNQLVEMAVRAMSPAINDPFTAMTCLDYIGDGLAQFIRQGEKSRYYFDNDTQLRLIMEPVTSAELLSTAFDMLRHASCDNASVLLHMLGVIDTIGKEAVTPGARQELHRHINLILSEAQAGKIVDWDQERISQRCKELAGMLQSKAV